ncbi:hypothetical protein [Kitasatospora sp. NPDC051914]|uniref:hypothetical protein n=1 Tax=Kitasatospora sp. NPDC051914 TaxID=3154945 RepID=UPI00342C206E
MNGISVARGVLVTARRQRLLAAIRQEGGRWDWRRAEAEYDTSPEPHIIRRDLMELCRAGDLVRVGMGEYEAPPSSDPLG